MSDEVRAAAVNRAIEIVNATEWWGDMRVNMTTLIGAGRVLAKALTDAANPADDATLVDFDWLKSIGFIERRGAIGQIIENETGRLVINVLDAKKGFESLLFLNDEEISLAPTRGEVRRLAAALKIELNETK